MSIADVPWLPLALALIYLAAAACIYRILMTYRVAQGAIAWILALIGLPYVAVPMFLLFGRNRFGGYIRARRTGDAALTELLNHFEQQTAAVSKRNDEHVPDELQVLCKLGRQPFTTGNRCDLLKNGKATFEALKISQTSWPNFFHDWSGGPAKNPLGDYPDSVWGDWKALYAQFEPCGPRPETERPASLLYDEIGALWQPIAEQDDWSAFQDKLASFKRR